MAALDNPVSASEAPPIEGKRDFLRSVQMARAVAMIFIIGTHCWPGIPWTPAEEHVLPIFFRSSTVLLVFLAGFLFNYTSGRFNYRRYVGRRLQALIIPYLIISAPIIFTILFVQHRDDVWPWVYEMPKIEQALVLLATGKHMAHFWYIPVAVMFTLGAGIFRLVDRYNLYVLLIPITGFAASVLGRDSLYGLYSPFGKALFVLPSFLFGMYFCNIYLRERRPSRWSVGVYIAIFVFPMYFYLQYNDWNLHFLWMQKVAFASLCIYFFDSVNLNETIYYVLDKVSEFALPLYFLHGYAIHALRVLFTDAEAVALFGGGLVAKSVWLTLKIFIVMMICLSGSVAVRRVLGQRSRYVIGA